MTHDPNDKKALTLADLMARGASLRGSSEWKPSTGLIDAIAEMERVEELPAPDPVVLLPEKGGQVVVTEVEAAEAYVGPTVVRAGAAPRLPTGPVKIRDDVDPRRQPTLRRVPGTSGTAAEREDGAVADGPERPRGRPTLRVVRRRENGNDSDNAGAPVTAREGTMVARAEEAAREDAAAPVAAAPVAVRDKPAAVQWDAGPLTFQIESLRNDGSLPEPGSLDTVLLHVGPRVPSEPNATEAERSTTPQPPHEASPVPVEPAAADAGRIATTQAVHEAPPGPVEPVATEAATEAGRTATTQAVHEAPPGPLEPAATDAGRVTTPQPPHEAAGCAATESAATEDEKAVPSLAMPSIAVPSAMSSKRPAGGRNETGARTRRVVVAAAAPAIVVLGLLLALWLPRTPSPNAAITAGTGGATSPRATAEPAAEDVRAVTSTGAPPSCAAACPSVEASANGGAAAAATSASSVSAAPSMTNVTTAPKATLDPYVDAAAPVIGVKPPSANAASSAPPVVTAAPSAAPAAPATRPVTGHTDGPVSTGSPTTRPPNNDETFIIKPKGNTP